MIDTEWKAIFIRELANNDLLCSEEKYRLGRDTIKSFGKGEWQRLEKTLSAKEMSRLLKWYGTQNPKREIQRILGFGFALTDFLIRPIERNEIRFKKFLEIGAIANLIICVFDSLVDNHSDHNWIRQYARRINSGFQESYIDRVLFWKDEKYMLMMSLTRVFMHRLYETIEDRKARDFVLKYVQVAFTAEAKTLYKMETGNRFIASRKSALAILLLGAPAIVVNSQEKERSGIGHFIWTYRVGELLGRVDDLCDYSFDIDNDSANYYKSDCSSELNEFNPVGEIVKLVSDIEHILRKYSADNDLKDYPGKSSFLLYAIISWIGGPRLESESENALVQKMGSVMRYSE